MKRSSFKEQIKEKLAQSYFFNIWIREYSTPVPTEMRWGIALCVRDGIITTMSWLNVISPLQLLSLLIVDSLKNFIHVRYVHTFRRIFNYHNFNCYTLNFIFYYLKRFFYTFIMALLISFIAFHFKVFTFEYLWHVVLSRFLGSSLYIVNNFEDHLIFNNVIKRATAINLGAIYGSLQVLFQQLDLARITFHTIRPCWISFLINLVMFISYQLFYLWSKRKLNMIRRSPHENIFS